MGTRLVYALAMGSTRTQPPREPYAYAPPPDEAPITLRTRMPSDTLEATRTAAILCAALGAALIARRVAWAGEALIAILLLLPGNRATFSLAWAEGLLLLGIGLCVAAYGTRAFGAACGVAATFKLTALGIWPLLLVPGASTRRHGSLALGVASAIGVWSLLTPASWYAFGPIYLVQVALNRVEETPSHVLLADGTLNVRYAWPVELLVLLALAVGLPRAVGMLARLASTRGAQLDRLRACSTRATRWLRPKRLRPGGARR